MYKVVSAMLVNFSYIVFAINILQGHHSVRHVICLSAGFLLTYFLWINVLFTVIIMFHFFSLTVCLKNLKHLEVYYVVFLLLIPLVFLWIPFVNNSYGFNANGVCWIIDTNTNCSSNTVGIIEQYTLWIGPCCFILAINVLAAVIVVIVLLCRGYCNGKESDREPLLAHHTSQHKKAVMELIPLLMYPAIFLFYEICLIVLNIEHSKKRDYDIHAHVQLIYSVVIPSWGMLSSIVLLLLIAATKCSKKKSQHQLSERGHVQYNKENGVEVVFTAASDTLFILQRESEVDNRYEEQQEIV